MTYLASVGTPTIPEEVSTCRLLRWTSEKGSRCCTCRGKSFSQAAPGLFAALREDEAHKQHQLKVSMHTREVRNLQVRAHQHPVQVALLCSEGNPIFLLLNAQPLLQGLGSNFPWLVCTKTIINREKTLSPSSHSPFSLHLLLPHFNFPYYLHLLLTL